MASRFWAAASDDSDEDKEVSEEESTEEESSSSGGDSDDSSSEDSSSSSASDSDSDSDDSDGRKGANRFMAGGSSDSDSDDERKIILKSAKDKRISELSEGCDEIRNKMKINDWSSIQTLFDELNKRLDRAVKVLDGGAIPRVYVKMLVELEDYLQETLANRDVKKKMSPTNARALNTMRQRLKKHNAQFTDQMQKFRANPESSDEEDEDDDEESSSSGSDEDQEDVEEDEEGFRKAGAKKKDKLLSMDPKEITYEMVNRKLREIIMTRGRRGTDKQEQVEMLTYLVNVAKGPAQKLEVLSQLVSSLFDLSPGISSYMKISLWKKCVLHLLEVCNILKDNPNIIVDENLDTSEERVEPPEEGAEVRVWGNLVAFIERLDDELFKSLQVIDPHTHEYLARMRDEPVFLALAQKIADYFNHINDMRSTPKVCLRLVEHFYYKTDAVYAAMRKLTIAQQQQDAAAALASGDGGDGEPDETVVVKVPQDYVMEEDCQAVMKQLVTVIFRHGDERTKARAMLCNIYHHCIHDDFYGARDMLLMSHLQDNIQHMDISTQILYNRTMAQLGIAAFRLGLISDGHNCMAELYGSGHIRELLAQGISMGKYQEKTPEQELLEKRRQMPFHMHISMELLESVYLISAMLLEVPAMAATPITSKKKIISKSFHRILDGYNKQTYTGPPENVRDHIMAATKCLMRGDWQKAYDYVAKLSPWNLLPQKDAVLAMIRSKLQEEALRTYLFTFSNQYKSLSLDQLCQMFDLPEKKVYSIVSKMMIAEELHGSWDQPTRTIVMHSLESTKLQELALQLSDKAAALVELNEGALAYRMGGLRENDDETGGSRRRGRENQWEDEGGQGRSRGGGKLGMVRMAGRDLGRRDGGRGGSGMGMAGGLGRGRPSRSGFRDRGDFGGGRGLFGRRTGYQENRNMTALGNINRPGYRDRRSQP